VESGRFWNCGNKLLFCGAVKLEFESQLKQLIILSRSDNSLEFAISIQLEQSKGRWGSTKQIAMWPCFSI
jgi:hypothetical protein